MKDGVGRKRQGRTGRTKTRGGRFGTCRLDTSLNPGIDRQELRKIRFLMEYRAGRSMGVVFHGETFYICVPNGGLAQLVEQWNHNPCVAGSSPAPATSESAYERSSRIRVFSIPRRFTIASTGSHLIMDPMNSIFFGYARPATFSYSHMHGRGLSARGAIDTGCIHRGGHKNPASGCHQ